MRGYSIKYMRPHKGCRYNEIIDSYTDRSDRLSISRLHDVAITPTGQHPGASENPMPDTLIDDCDFCASIQNKEHAPSDITHLDGKVLYAGFFRTQWGHFLMNSTARLWPLFTGAVEEADHILFFTDTMSEIELKGNYKEFLELAGISSKVVITHKTVAVDELIVPEISFEHTRYFSRETLAVFEAVKKAASKGEATVKSKDILLTRSALPGASKDEINISWIDELFARNGFEIVSPEKISLSELIRILSAARKVASLSGSTAHNFLFADPKSEFIIVERTAVNNTFQIGLNIMAGLDCTTIDAFRLPAIAPSTGRLFLYGLTSRMESFIKDNDWKKPEFKDGAGRRRRELLDFLKLHRRHYGYTTGLEVWATEDLPSVAEAYHESFEYYRPWLERRRPLFLKDYLSPRCLFRMFKDKI